MLVLKKASLSNYHQVTASSGVPPLIVTEEQLDFAYTVLEEAIYENEKFKKNLNMGIDRSSMNGYTVYNKQRRYGL